MRLAGLMTFFRYTISIKTMMNTFKKRLQDAWAKFEIFDDDRHHDDKLEVFTISNENIEQKFEGLGGYIRRISE